MSLVSSFFNVFFYPWSLEPSRSLLTKKYLIIFLTQEKCKTYRTSCGIKRGSSLRLCIGLQAGKGHGVGGVTLFLGILHILSS